MSRITRHNNPFLHRYNHNTTRKNRHINIPRHSHIPRPHMSNLQYKLEWIGDNNNNEMRRDKDENTFGNMYSHTQTPAYYNAVFIVALILGSTMNGVKIALKRAVGEGKLNNAEAANIVRSLINERHDQIENIVKQIVSSNNNNSVNTLGNNRMLMVGGGGNDSDSSNLFGGGNDSVSSNLVGGDDSKFTGIDSNAKSNYVGDFDAKFSIGKGGDDIKNKFSSFGKSIGNRGSSLFKNAFKTASDKFNELAPEDLVTKTFDNLLKETLTKDAYYENLHNVSKAVFTLIEDPKTNEAVDNILKNVGSNMKLDRIEKILPQIEIIVNRVYLIANLIDSETVHSIIDTGADLLLLGLGKVIDATAIATQFVDDKNPISEFIMPLGLVKKLTKAMRINETDGFKIGTKEYLQFMVQIAFELIKIFKNVSGKGVEANKQLKEFAIKYGFGMGKSCNVNVKLADVIKNTNKNKNKTPGSVELSPELISKLVTVTNRTEQERTGSDKNIIQDQENTIQDLRKQLKTLKTGNTSEEAENKQASPSVAIKGGGVLLRKRNRNRTNKKIQQEKRLRIEERIRKSLRRHFV